MTTLHVTIRRNADGAVRVSHWPDWHPWGSPGYADDYWWSDGNMGCDCNREWEFLRAGGEPLTEHPECGETRYTVLAITQDDDPTVVYTDDRNDRREVFPGTPLIPWSREDIEREYPRS